MGGEDIPVVISGIGGKFPESDNVLQLQEKLFTKEDFVTNEVRWTTDTVGVGKIRDIDTFDASPFKMHTKLVRASDPTTTQTLERAFEAIIDAGMNPFAMSGRNIAVISASMVSDSENTRAGTSYETSGFTIMGHNRSMVANRISYTFNFTGPSYSIHTSWAGGMRALEQGAKLIAQGLAEGAVVTTASLIFYKATGVEYQDMDLLTPGGRCQSFDAQANGTCRSEGVVSFFLQRAKDAKRNYATLVSVRADCLGLRSCSLIQMDNLLTESLRNFYEKNNINTEDIAYLEADGSGIKSFDTLELNALSSVFFGKRKKPLPIGSVKSNVGNTEASSAFLGITKSIIAFETGLIPPNIHYKTPNPDVPALVNGQFQPVTEATELKGDLVSVNTLSIGGTMGHVVIRRNSKEKQALSMGQMPPDGLHRLIMVSARHEEGAKANAKRLQSMPVDVEYTALVNDVFKTNLPGYLWKSFVVVPSAEVKYNIKNYDNVKQPLWFCFSGMGSQWTGMGRDLLRIPIFAAAVDKCDAVLQPRGVDIRHILTTDDATIFDNILNCFVGIATVQIGLVDILRAVGLEPDGMIGHSVGELGCAYADGCFTAEEMVLAAYARGKASLESEVIQGMMAAIGLGYKDMKDRIPSSIDIACHNSSDSCTLSGPTEDVVNYVTQLKEQNIFAKAVSAGNIAYHSRYIEPIGPKLLQYLSELIKEPKARSAKWVSSSVPEADWTAATAQLSSAEYHTNNLLSPVLFEEACRHLPTNAIVVEIAPHGLLQAILRRSLSTCVNIPLTNRLADNGVKQLLESLGNLYLNNVSLDVNALYPAVEYPVSRGTPYLAPLITWEHHENWFHEFENILQLMSRSKDLEVQLDETAEDYSLWSNHCVEDQIVLTLSQNLVYVWKLLCSSKTLDIEKEPVIFENVIMSQQVILQPVSQLLGVTIRRGTNCFEVCFKEQEEDWKTILTGTLKQNPKSSANPVPEESIKEEVEKEEVEKKEVEKEEVEKEEKENEIDEVEVSGAEILRLLSHFGYKMGTQFCAVKHLLRRKCGFAGKVQWTGNMVTFLDTIFKLVLFVEMEKEQRFLYTSAFRTLSIESSLFSELENGTEIEVQYDSSNNILTCKGLHLDGLTFSPDPEVFKKMPPLQWKTKGFVTFNNEKLELEEFLSMTLQLVAQEGLNSWKPKNSRINMINVRGYNDTDSFFTKSLRQVSKSLPQISIKYEEVELSQAGEKSLFLPGESYLVSGSYASLKQIGGSVPTNVFLLAHVSAPEVTRNGLSPVMTHHLKCGGQLVVLKKRADVSQLRVLELEKEQWFSDLTHLFNGSDNGQPVVVVCRKWRPSEILPGLSKQKFAQRLRFLFLDKSAPRFSLNLPLYKGQVSLGLSVSQLSRGVWGTECILPVNPNSLNLSENMQGIITSSDPNLDVNVVSLNTSSLTYQPDTHDQSNETQAREGEVEFVEYCGTRVGGERVVGLAKHCDLTNTLTPDPTLSWAVPPQWSMEEAATLPAPLLLAYYCLHVKGKIKAGERVLVQIGTCPISQAFIALALHAGADVFVTIQAKEHLASLLTAFPQLKPDQVLSLDHFDTVIKIKTGGLGMDIVVNCLQDSDTNLSISCLGDDSRFFHLSKIDFRDRQIIGMGVFLKNANFYGVSLTNIINADSDTKTKLQVYLKEALKKGIVKPFRKRLFTLQNFAHAIKNMKSRNWQEKTVVVIKPEGRSELPPNSLQGFHCHPDKTYVILGSGEGLWLNVAEWLVQRGARKLLIAPGRDSLSSSFSRRLDRLVTLCYERVMLSNAVRLNSQAQALDFLREAESLGPVAGIFCIALEENSPQVAFLDSATRQMKLNLQHFVCLFGGSSAVCECRARQELPSCLVRAEVPLSRPKAVLPYLSSLMACDSSAHTFIVSEELLTSNQDNLRVIEQDPRNYLPSSAAELFLLGEEVHTRPLLHEEVTRSPAHEAVRYSSLPVIMLPGTYTARLQSLVKHLMHPAYCASLPVQALSVQDAANALLQEVLRVQEKGPYNVVGETWSGGVALQLAVLLESQGHQVELFLLDAAPLSVQQSATLLRNKNVASLDINLLTTLLNLDSKVAKQLSQLKSWEEQSQTALNLVRSTLGVLNEELQTVHETVLKALTALRCYLTALLAYKPPTQLFKGGVHLIRPKGSSEIDFCGLQTYCQQRPQVYVMEEEDHQQMVNSHACATIINENLLFTWEL